MKHPEHRNFTFSHEVKLINFHAVINLARGMVNEIPTYHTVRAVEKTIVKIYYMPGICADRPYAIDRIVLNGDYDPLTATEEALKKLGYKIIRVFDDYEKHIVAEIDGKYYEFVVNPIETPLFDDYGLMIKAIVIRVSRYYLADDLKTALKLTPLKCLA